MGKLSDAIRECRRRRSRSIGFAAASDDRRASLLIASRDRVDGADIHVLNPGDDPPDDGIWGFRLANADHDAVADAVDKGAHYVTLQLADARADALLHQDIDYVILLDAVGDRQIDVPLDEAQLKAVASLRPAVVVAPTPEFPLALTALLDLRRTAMQVAAPLAVDAPADISDHDLELLRDSGVAVVLPQSLDPDSLQSLRERIRNLPERKPQRDHRDDPQPLLPTRTTEPNPEDDEDFE